MGPFRGPYRGSPLWDPCWWAVTTEVAAHWEEVLMGPFRGGAHNLYTKTCLARVDSPGFICNLCFLLFLLGPTGSYLDKRRKKNGVWHGNPFIKGVFGS